MAAVDDLRLLIFDHGWAAVALLAGQLSQTSKRVEGRNDLGVGLEPCGVSFDQFAE